MTLAIVSLAARGAPGEPCRAGLRGAGHMAITRRIAEWLC